MTGSGTTRRPPSVLFAVGLQLLTAVPFLLSIIVVWRDGADAQTAAEAELTRQGVPTSVLADHGVSFGSNTAEIPIPAAIILALIVLALLNLAGNRVGRTLSWIFHPILLVAGIVIIPGQVFTTSVLESSFRVSGDAVCNGSTCGRSSARPNGSCRGGCRTSTVRSSCSPHSARCW
jgi:hypothetical protein